MTKIQKRLVGLGCLALVAAVTTVAYNIPDVNAESATGTVDINFTVVPNTPYAKFESPENGYETTNPSIPVRLVYSNAEEIIYTLTKKGTDGAADQSVIINGPAIDSTLIHTFVLNLNDEFGEEGKNAYGTYVLKATVKNGDATPAEDSVTFTYKLSDVCVGDDCPKPEPEPECEGDECEEPECEGDECEEPECEGEDCFKDCENGNCKPEDECLKETKTITVTVDKGVNKVLIILYNQSGKEVYRKMYKVTGGKSNVITLDFTGYCLKAGVYKISNVPYTPDGPIISEAEAKKNTVTIEFGSKQEGPNVPNTGDFLAKLNISNADFLITGLIGFSAVAILGFVLLNKKQKRN